MFNREGLGEIDLPYGDHKKKYGLDHIVEKHVREQDDFASVEEVASVLEDVITNGEVVTEDGIKAQLEKDGYRVAIRKNLKDEQGNPTDDKRWVVTAFDTTRTKEEKALSRGTLTTPPPNPNGADGVALPSNSADSNANIKKPAETGDGKNSEKGG